MKLKFTRIFFLGAFLFFNNLHAQIININAAADSESSLSLEDLVRNVLISGDCAQVDTFSEQVSGTPTETTTKSYGYFRKPTGSRFPFEEGVVLTTGRAFEAGNTVGPTNPPTAHPDNNNLQGGDTDLETALGQTNTNDATFIKFNFVPTSTEISFRFIMASEEYDMSTECNFADSFAFLLRPVGTTTYTNLAVLPDGTPVSVRNINNAPGCTANTRFFAGYDIGDTNYGGQTVVLTATSVVIPNQTYEIKLVVADQGDSAWDSAIFLEAGSFVLDADLGNRHLVGDNTAVCGSSILLDATIVAPDYKWYYDDGTGFGPEIPGENSQTFNANLGDGLYKVEAIFTAGCIAEDSVRLEFVVAPTATTPLVLSECDDDFDGSMSFNLRDRDSDILNGQSVTDFEVVYFRDAAYTDEIIGADITSFSSTGQTIFARVRNLNSTNCVADTSFDLEVYERANPSTTVSLIGDCDNTSVGTDVDGFIEFNLHDRATEILNGQAAVDFTLTYYTDAAYTIQIPVADEIAFTNTVAGGQTIFVRMTNNLTSTFITPCFTDTSFEIDVFEQPTAFQPSKITLCDDDNNGTMNFDLSSQDATILGGQSVAIFEVLYFTDAALTNQIPRNTTPIAGNDVTDYANDVSLTINGVQPIFAQIRNIANPTCDATTTFDIEVYDSAFPSTAVTLLAECDNTSVGTDTDGFIEFNLYDRTTEILNGQAAADFTLTYYTDAAYTIQIPVADETAFTNTVAGGQTIHVRMTNNLTSTFTSPCFTDTEFDIEVFEKPVLNTPPYVLEQCDDDFDGFNSFNLSEINTDIITTITTEVFTYYESSLEADAGVPGTEIPNPTTYTNQVVNTDNTIWVRAENANGCYRTSQFTLVVKPSAIPPTFLRTFSQCDDGADNRDGVSTFDFSSVTAEVQAMFPTAIDVFYYRNQADATAEINEITDPSNYENIGFPNMQEVWVRADSQLGNDCLGNGHHITLIVEELPTANMPTTIMKECDDDGDGAFPFDVSTITSEILNGQSLADVTITYFNEDGTPVTGVVNSSLPNPFTTISQTIDIVVTNNNTNDPDGACSEATTLVFVVDASPINNVQPIPAACEDDPEDGLLIATFDTSNLESSINAQAGMDITYLDSTGNPLQDMNGNLIVSPFPNSFTTETQTITVVVTNPANTSCPASVDVDFTVNPRPIFDDLDDEIVCSNLLPHFIKVTNPDATNYNYEWFNTSGASIGTSQTLQIIDATDITTTGITYSVTATNPTTGCERTKFVNLKKSSDATLLDDDIVTVEFNSPENSIEIITTNLGFGDYEYSLVHESDSRTWQDEPIFTNLQGGMYTVYINDKNDCGEISKVIFLLDYPKFLTPNNDGFNDYWQLIGLDSTTFTISPIQIFDRFGKIVAIINPTQGQGWEGLYNNEMLPSSDYWFALSLTNNDGETFIKRGHFSLIRRQGR